MSKGITDILAAISIADVAGFITIISFMFMATKKGRNWLTRPALDISLKNRLDLIRLEILFLLHTQPNNVEGIEKTFDDYKKLGGNSYIDYLIEKWKTEQKEKLEM